MVAASPQVIKRGAAGAAGCVEGLWSASLRGRGKRFLRLTGLMAGGFLGLTAFQAEGCGIALSGDEYKASVTRFIFCVI